MTHLTRFFMLIFLTMLCLKIGSSPATVNAQGSDTDQEEPKTIPHAEVITQLLDFTEEGVEDCTLPCFAKIRPGETTLQETRDLSVDLFDGDDSILAQFDTPFERDDTLIDYTLQSEVFNGYFDLSFIFSPEGEVLRRFKARLFRPENWLESSNLDISEVLAVLGIPDEVYIAIAASQPPQFDIALGYETLGTVFLYTYSFEYEQLTQGDEPIPLCGCWSKTYSVDVWIQAVDEEFYEALLDENLNLDENESADGIVYQAFWPLERMTNWNIEDLTQFLVENPEWCFDALSYEELLEAGYSY